MQVKVGCLIVDPATSEIIAVACDCRKSHPLQHAVMIAVDLVARSQGGGAWKINSKYIKIFGNCLNKKVIYSNVKYIF